MDQNQGQPMQAPPPYPGQSGEGAAQPVYQTQPPQYEYPAQPAYPDYQTQPGYQAQPAGGQTVLISIKEFGPNPMSVDCHHCKKKVVTLTKEKSGLLTYILVSSICVVTLFICCCYLGLIPCCIRDCKDIEHRCPQCGTHLGVYRRIG